MYVKLPEGAHLETSTLQNFRLNGEKPAEWAWFYLQLGLDLSLNLGRLQAQFWKNMENWSAEGLDACWSIDVWAEAESWDAAS